MEKKIVLLDPTAEKTPELRERVKRPSDLEGKIIGLLDISKPRGDIFLNEIEKQFIERGLQVKRFQKPTFAKVAPTPLKQEISTQCDVVIEALAD